MADVEIDYKALYIDLVNEVNRAIDILDDMYYGDHATFDASGILDSAISTGLNAIHKAG